MERDDGHGCGSSILMLVVVVIGLMLVMLALGEPREPAPYAGEARPVVCERTEGAIGQQIVDCQEAP